MRANFAAYVVVVFALLAAPEALACENPDDIRYTLRTTPPKTVNPGEFVLELDVSSRTDVEGAPTVLDSNGLQVEFANFFAVFDVRRVHAGDFSELQVRIPYLLDSCSSFYAGMEASYFVGGWWTNADGRRGIMVRPISHGELRTEREASEQGAN